MRQVKCNAAKAHQCCFDSVFSSELTTQLYTALCRGKLVAAIAAASFQFISPFFFPLVTQKRKKKCIYACKIMYMYPICLERQQKRD